MKHSETKQTPPLDVHAHALLEAVEALSLHLASRLPPDLSRSEAALLSLLLRCDSLSGREIANATGLACSSVTGVCDRLESRGLIGRRRDEDDRRVVQVALTPAGRRTARACLDILLDLARTMLAPLSPAEQAQFVAMYSRISASLPANPLPASKSR